MNRDPMSAKSEATDETKIEACRAYARMMNNLDYRALEPWLADDFHYESQWVLDEITSKAAYEAYIVPKLETIRRTGSRVWAELAFTDVFGSGPCVVLAQGERNNRQATLLVTMLANRISRMDLCCVPAPQECRLTGEIPT
jgi:hypothetical protein